MSGLKVLVWVPLHQKGYMFKFHFYEQMLGSTFLLLCLGRNSHIWTTSYSSCSRTSMINSKEGCRIGPITLKVSH